MLIDQIHHGRPLVNGMFPPDSSSAPASYRKVADLPPFRHLYECAFRPEAQYAHDAALGRATLSKLGITSVYVDAAAFPDGKADPRYLSCVAEVLGEPTEQDGPFQIYAL